MRKIYRDYSGQLWFPFIASIESFYEIESVVGNSANADSFQTNG